MADDKDEEAFVALFFDCKTT